MKTEVFESKLADFQEKNKALEKEAKKLKASFVKLITNKKVPFANRLKLFKDTPDTCKEHSNWLPSNRREGPVADLWDEFLQGEGDNGYRGHVVNICDTFADQIYAYLEDEEDFADYGIFNNTEDFEKFFEDIFQRNLGSFVFDW